MRIKEEKQQQGRTTSARLARPSLSTMTFVGCADYSVRSAVVDSRFRSSKIETPELSPARIRRDGRGRPSLHDVVLFVVRHRRFGIFCLAHMTGGVHSPQHVVGKE